MTDDDIQSLIACPKKIVRVRPKSGYDGEGRHRRRELVLKEKGGARDFLVFIRQNNYFIENFSIGLCYKTGSTMQGTLNLVRYNGSHGESNWSRDGHYIAPHIHRLTADLLQRGVKEPGVREITDRYANFDDAPWSFGRDCNIINWRDFFIRQISLFPDEGENG